MDNFSETTPVESSTKPADNNPVEEKTATLADSPPLRGERVAFTGTLASMTHREAFGHVERLGGIPTHSVSRQTTLLVVGEEGWALEPDGQPSQKLLQVLQWQREANTCRILREADWLHLIGLAERRPEVHAEYTPAMLSRLLDVPVSRIRRWVKVGLLQPTRTVGRLPLFDYQEVTGARRVVELLQSGVKEETLQQAVRKLRSLHRSEFTSVSQLPMESQWARLLCRDERGLKEALSGQRCFDFADLETQEEPAQAADTDGGETGQTVLSFVQAAQAAQNETPLERWTADDWFRQGYRLLENERPAEAVEAFRMVLMELPGNPEANFYLAEALYRSGNREGALERYYTALEADREYVEAWLQLGCLLAELEDTEGALDAFRIVLRIHPDNADAHWHLADLLWHNNRSKEAIPHWETYLQYDSESPWAQTARQCLEQSTSSPSSPS